MFVKNCEFSKFRIKKYNTFMFEKILQKSLTQQEILQMEDILVAMYKLIF